MTTENDIPGRSVAEKIRNGLGRLTPTERRPALLLLSNYPVAGLETVAKFADRAGVSSPTILRLVAKLDFGGYPEFQHALRDELGQRLQPPLAKTPPPPQHPSDGDFLTDYTNAIVANINDSMREISREEFKTVVSLLIDERRRVLIIGGRFTSNLASHLHLHLRELRPQVHLVNGQTETWADHLLDLGRNDILLAFDIRRFQEDVAQFARQAAANNAQVILFTDTWVSPIAAIAKHVFVVRTLLPSSWESFASLLTLSETLIAQTHIARWPKSKKRMERLERLRGSLSEDPHR